jgi:hypothetical protein
MFWPFSASRVKFQLHGMDHVMKMSAGSAGFGEELAGTDLISIGRQTENGGFYGRILPLRVSPRAA